MKVRSLALLWTAESTNNSYPFPTVTFVMRRVPSGWATCTCPCYILMFVYDVQYISEIAMIHRIQTLFLISCSQSQSSSIALQALP